jgi:hypothetical protein
MSITEIVRTTCPRDCYDSCGISVVKRDRVIRQVRGDKDSPVNRGALCGKCALAYNGILRDPGARLTTPLKRVGPKGAGRFTPISWDDALEATASWLKRIVAESGPESIVYAHYTGTISKIAYAFPLRFFNRLGATEVEPDTICNMAGHVALRYTIGTSLIGFERHGTRTASSCGGRILPRQLRMPTSTGSWKPQARRSSSTRYGTRRPGRRTSIFSSSREAMRHWPLPSSTSCAAKECSIAISSPDM